MQTSLREQVVQRSGAEERLAASWARAHLRPRREDREKQQPRDQDRYRDHRPQIDCPDRRCHARNQDPTNSLDPRSVRTPWVRRHSHQTTLPHGPHRAVARAHPPTQSLVIAQATITAGCSVPRPPASSRLECHLRSKQAIELRRRPSSALLRCQASVWGARWGLAPEGLSWRPSRVIGKSLGARDLYASACIVSHSTMRCRYSEATPMPASRCVACEKIEQPRAAVRAWRSLRP